MQKAAPHLGLLGTTSSLLISRAVNSSHSSDRAKWGASQWRTARDMAAPSLPCCSRRRSRQGNTGWDSGRGWKQGRVDRAASCWLRATLWVTPAGAPVMLRSAGLSQQSTHLK